MPGLVIILFCEEKKLPKKKLCVDCLRTMCCCTNRRASNLPQNLGQRLTAIVVVSISDRSIDPPIYHMCRIKLGCVDHHIYHMCRIKLGCCDIHWWFVKTMIICCRRSCIMIVLLVSCLVEPRLSGYLFFG